jgi:hypothetical protein
MRILNPWWILGGVFVAAAAQAQTPAMTRLRGEVLEATAQTIVLRETSGARTSLPVAGDLVVSEVAPIDPGTIHPGVFLGTTAIPGPDGALSAVEVHVFSEALRGRGEGHRVMDAGTGATMTNATVATVAPGTNARTLVLRYADGEKTVRVPEGVPVVSMTAGTRALLVPGAKVSVTTQVRDGQATAVRAIVGHAGYAPPF